jgi:hypothetical protein
LQRVNDDEKEMEMKKTVGILLAMGLACAANAGISLYGDGAGYDSNNKDWLTETTVDIDGNGLGTDGYIFFGDFNSTYDGNVTWTGGGDVTLIQDTLITDVLPSYVSSATMGANANAKIGQYNSYESIDSPRTGDGTDAVCGNIITTGAGEVLDFTISGLAAGETVRVGIVTVLNDGTRGAMGVPEIGLTDGADTVTVTGLPNLSLAADATGPGWVFFDIDSNGDYTITSIGDGDVPDVGSIGGVTFDSVYVPAAGANLTLAGALALELVAPDTSTTGSITASYSAGTTTSSDITIVSALADAGFTATVANSIGLANPNEEITVTFDNSGIGLANGESTNSTLVVTWTEVGSGVINTSHAALSVTYVNVPSSVGLAPTSLSLDLIDPDTSTNGTVVASFVEGTLGADVEIVSVTATNGFSVDPGSFTLGTGNTNEDITVTFFNSVGLMNNGDTADSALVLTWTEAGSGVINTSQAALSVTYVNEPSSIELAPTTLSLTLNAPDTSVNDTITASFVAGTHPTDVEIVSLTSTNTDFSASVVNSTLGTGNSDEDITVTYSNSGALVNHGDTDSSTLVVTWTELDSGVINTATTALVVSYYNQAILPNLIAAYDFDGSSDNSAAATLVTENVTAGAFTDHMGTAFVAVIGDNSGLDASGADFGSSVDPSYKGCVGIGVDDAITDSFADAVAGGDYVSFTVTPADGYALNLSDISFKASKTAGTSVDEYGVTLTNNVLIGSSATITTIGQNTVYEGVIIDLSDSQFQGITETTEFRIYAWGRGTTETSSTLAMLDKVVLKGTVDPSAVPSFSGVSVSDGSFIIAWEPEGIICDVLTNANLVSQNWGVLQTGSSPITITNAIDSGYSQMFYKLSLPEE